MCWVLCYEQGWQTPTALKSDRPRSDPNHSRADPQNLAPVLPSSTLIATPIPSLHRFQGIQRSYTLAHSPSIPDLSWSHHRHHHRTTPHTLHPPPSPPPADYDPDERFAWQQSEDGMSITQNLPLSPLQSPSPDQTTFSTAEATVMERSPSTYPLSYAPFRSSPLATSNARATIRRISETGEMEMEDTEEMDMDESL